MIIVISIAALLGFRQVLPSKIFTETGITKNVVVDSLMLEAVEADGGETEKDTLSSNKKIVFEAVNGIKFPAETFEDYKGYQHLVNFYEKLLQLETKKQGKVRIAYFGDSMTDGDLIVKDFRASLQERFGGEGVGFVNITSESAPSRSTLTHQFSPNWKTQSYLNVKSPRSPFGVNGHVFFTKRDTVNPAWVRYKASNIRHLTELYNPTLFYGKSGNRKAAVDVIIGKDTIRKNLNPVNLVNTLSVANGGIKGFKANFIASDSIPFYGFNFDDGRGVHVDNFSNRGNSGLPIGSFNTNVMRAFNDKLGYDLIVLHYGTNVLNYGSLNYTWYEKRMARVVEHLRECFPGVDILIISTADKSTKYGLEMKTDSAVVPLSRAQKKYAVQTESAYVNLYTLMGGDGSMVKWVDEEAPALANKDYTHFNFRGAKKVSDLIWNQINGGYEQYKRLRGFKTPTPPAPAPQTGTPVTEQPKAEQPKTPTVQPAKKPIVKKDTITPKKDTTHAP
ncbi:hypothetical protein HYN59_00660 [Flavobacterium album]|uniref:SGNH hydrolase-type esterase domain-containing protein n=1 Tax=Flavobacterium album TaxID=2175091 RepID=A0A2S1R2I6_9FLAO|nr:hypothetical protein [Flavobacterium album]AWH86880.1 hypothetical protein HYN59_00660 [Flavobacterium album]